jgi:hypothetical protein
MVSPVRAGGVVARRREAYYAAIAGRSSYGARLSMPAGREVSVERSA